MSGHSDFGIFIKEVEGVKQQEEQENKRDEEIGDEVNGEVEEVTQHTHETWRWLWDEQGTNLSHSVCNYQGRQSKDNDTNWQQKERPRKRKIYNAWRLMHWHQLRSHS